MNEKFLGRFSSKWPESLAMRELSKSFHFEATRNLGFVEEEDAIITNVVDYLYLCACSYFVYSSPPAFILALLQVSKLFEAFLTIVEC